MVVKPEIPVDSAVADPQLPPQIFVWDYYLIGRRINEYSKPEWVGDIVAALERGALMEKLKNSQFGYLFTIPPRILAFSGKIVHNMLSRQLWTTNEGELWFVFAGQPFRYSIREFGIVTGLSRTHYPDETSVEEKTTKPAKRKSYLEELTGRKSIKVKQLMDMLMYNKDWPDWKKIKRCAETQVFFRISVGGEIPLT